MNKIFVLAIILVVITGGYFFIIATDETVETVGDNTINSSHGFYFTPPEGWVLHEGLSSFLEGDTLNMGSSADAEQAKKDMQKHMDRWKIADSSRLWFVRSGLYEDSRIFEDNYRLFSGEGGSSNEKVVMLISSGSYVDNKYDFGKEYYSETITTEVSGKEAFVVVAGKKSEEVKTVNIYFTLDSDTYLQVVRRFDKNDEVYLQWFEDFLTDLKVK